MFLDYLEDGIPSGGNLATVRFAKLLKKRGHNVIFLTAKMPGKSREGRYNRIKTYRLSSIPFLKKQNVYIIVPNPKKLKEIFEKEKIDVLDIMVPTPGAVASMKIAKSLGIRVVSHSFGQPENVLLCHGNLRNKNLDNLFYKYLAYAYKKSDITICPSKFAEMEIKKYARKLNIITISCGVDFSKFKKTNSTQFLKKYGIPKKSKKILFVGRLHNEKNISLLINAMPKIIERVKDTHLCIVGSGKLSEHLEKEADILGIKSNVTFLGKIPEEDIPLAYNCCDFFALPSLAELEGIVVLEAMACGKPILVAKSRASAARFFVQENGFLFSPHSPNDFADKAIKLLENEPMRKNMALKSLEQVQDYDINKSVEMLEKVYNSN